MNRRLSRLTIPGPVGPLQAVLQEHEGREPDVVAVVCHPHPLYGGTLDNKVAHRIATTLHELGVAVLRFNFRGAGESAGVHDEGTGEVDDARAALDWIGTRHPRARRWVAGFSFGSWVAARLVAARADVDQLVLVAPPVARSSFEALITCTVPKLVIQGTHDDVCPLEMLQEQFPTWAEPKRLVLVPEAGHFFDRRLAELGRALTEALGPALRAAPSS